MSKVQLTNIERYAHFYPKVACIVTVHAGGFDNGMAVAWNMPLSMNPPVYAVSISPRRYTHELIMESREFAINFIPYELEKMVLAMGAISGREGSKFERFGIETMPAAQISAPILKDAYAAYECRLVESHTYGDHDLLVGEIVAIHYEEDAFTEDGTMKPDRVHPVLYIGANTFGTISAENFHVLDREVVARDYKRTGS